MPNQNNYGNQMNYSNYQNNGNYNSNYSNNVNGNAWTGYCNNVQQQFQYQDQRPSGFVSQNNNVPVRVIFNPDQISPQEIPTDGTPALFPLNDGKMIILKSMMRDGTFNELRYVLQMPDGSTEESEFDQVMSRLLSIESALQKVVEDLYENNNEDKKEEK